MNRKEEKKLADYLELEKEAVDPVDQAPTDEFKQIIAEMNRREIVPQIREELNKKKKTKK